MATSFQKKLTTTIMPKLQKDLQLGNTLGLPKLQKVVVSAGIRSDIKDPKLIDTFARDIAAITGQAPVKTRSHKSISSFKIRQGQVIGLMVTLRGKRMYEFVDKLINVALPRVRDFRGLDPKGFDRSGNYSIGFRDQLSFPEISAESVTASFGLQVTLVVDAQNQMQAKQFIYALGLPIKQ